jgi:excisionase family DNA binding protein
MSTPLKSAAEPRGEKLRSKSSPFFPDFLVHEAHAAAIVVQLEPAMPTTDQQYISHPIDRAARMSGISRSRIYELIAAGDLPLVKLGRRSLIRDVDLRQLIDRHLKKPEKAG